MDVSEQDRLMPAPRQQRSLRWLLLLVAVALLIAFAYYYIDQAQTRTTSKTMESAVEIPLTAGQATISQAIQRKTTPIPRREPQLDKQRPSLPALQDSDDFLRQHWQTFGLPETTTAWIADDFLLQRAVTFVDGLANGAILRKTTPLNKAGFLLPKSPFNAIKSNEELWLDEANFARYNAFVGFLTALDPQNLAQLFHRLRPLLEAAYAELGQPPEQFGNRLTAALDLMLDTPDINMPIKLTRETVFYRYEDPALEALPAAQKLLIRMGPQHRSTVKGWLASLKQALLAEDQAPDTVLKRE